VAYKGSTHYGFLPALKRSDESPHTTCLPVKKAPPPSALGRRVEVLGFVALQAGAGSIQAGTARHHKLAWFGRVIDRGTRSRGQLLLGYDAGRGGLRPIMTPLAEGAIRADQKDEQQLLARSA
jgi:hypothetical protein